MPEYKPNIFVRQIPIGPMMNFSYLIGPKDGDGAVLIDPSWDADRLMKAAKDEGRNIEAIIATHTHFDHVNALDEIATKLGIPVYVHEAEALDLAALPHLNTTTEGKVIEEAGLSIKCLHTPGHTKGSQCFYVENTLFSGDTLFVEGCGRVDLEGGDPNEMMASLKRLSELPDDTIVFPGHDYGSAKSNTIGEQKKNNPYMRKDAPKLT